MGRRVLDGLSDRVPRSTLDDARLLLSELLTNAIRHAGLSEDETISVLIAANDAELHIEVADRGRGFEAGRHDPSSATGTGWGLFLLDRLADAWGTERDASGGSVVWFTLGFPDDA
jgi:anti-sigma regulatory factor (Ser/Thr protein kinase)